MKKILTITLILTATLFAQSAQNILETNGCFACHAVASKKSAPAFAGIAKRNKRFNADNAQASIINGIKNGSEGKYRHFTGVMPAFPHLDNESLRTVADYILAQSSKAKGQGQGCNGSRCNH